MPPERAPAWAISPRIFPSRWCEVEGKPVLEHIVEGLRDEAGIRDFFIITGWCGHVIRDYFGDGTHWNVNITYGEQVVQDGTGKAPELAKDWVGQDSFLLTYGDILLRPPTDYALLVEAFREDGVIAVKDGEDLTKGGAVVLDQRRLHDRSGGKGLGRAARECLLQRGHLSAARRASSTSPRKLEKSPRGEYEFTDALKACVKAGARLRGVTLQRRLGRRARSVGAGGVEPTCGRVARPSFPSCTWERTC